MLRALLGVAEAAFGPGIPFYLTFFYKRSELAYRVGLFISAAPLATSFASSLAWAIVKISGENGFIEPWRALFLIEGFPSIVVAVFAFYLIPDSPSTARFLTPRERRVAKLRLLQPLNHRFSSSTSTSSSGLSLQDLLTTLLDPKAYLTAFMFFSANISFSSLPVFLPTILHDMSFSPLASQALAAPPYLFAFAFVLFTSRLSDRTPNSRAYSIIAVSLLSSFSYTSIALAGYFSTTTTTTLLIIIRYIAVYGAAMGFFSAITLIITWTLNNQRSATGKGMGMTILNVIGQCGPLLGVRLFPNRDAPFYVRGMLICAAFMLGVALLAAGLRWDLKRRNMRNAGGGEDDDDDEVVGGRGDGAAGAGEGLMMRSRTGKRRLRRERGKHHDEEQTREFIFML